MATPIETAAFNSLTKLWSRRWSVSRGHHWQFERSCEVATAGDWLRVFRQDEPDVEFILSPKKPRED